MSSAWLHHEQMPKDRIENKLRVLGENYEPPLGWQRRVLDRVDRKMFVSDGISVCILLAWGMLVGVLLGAR